MRGLSETALVAIILAVAGGLVVGGITTGIIVKSRASINIAACRASVDLAANTAQVFSVSKCATRDAGTLAASATPANYPTQTSSELARLLYECRYQFGEVAHTPWKGNWFSNDPLCFVCSTFKVSSTVTTETTINWMRKNLLPNGGSYFDYVLKSVPGNDPAYLLMDSYDQAKNTAELGNAFSPGTDYAIIDFAIPGRRLTQLSGKQFTFSGGVEDTKETNWVFVTKTSSLNKACSVTFLRYP